MQHQFYYKGRWTGDEGRSKALISSLVVKGEDSVYTAMAKTVGLPLAIATKLILNGKVNRTGVHIPVYKEIYEPILNELKTLGIDFVETEK